MQNRSQAMNIALIVIGVIVAGLLLFSFLESRHGHRIADRPDVATCLDHRGDTRLPGRHPGRRATALHDRVRYRWHLRGASGLQFARRHLHARSQRWHDDHTWPEHARGLSGRVVRQPLRTCSRDRDDVGDHGRRPDADHVGWRDRHLRGRRERARRPDSDGVDAAEFVAIRISVRRAVCRADAELDTKPDGEPDRRRPRRSRQPPRPHPPPRQQVRHRPPRRRRLRRRHSGRRQHRRRRLPRRRPRHRRPPRPQAPRRRPAATSSGRAGSSRRSRRAIPWPGPTSLQTNVRTTPSCLRRAGPSVRRPTAMC